LITDPAVVSVLEKEAPTEKIDLFNENKIYTLVNKKDQDKQTDKSSINGSDSQSQMRTSSSICLTQESCNSNEGFERTRSRHLSSRFMPRCSMLDAFREEESGVLLSKFKDGLNSFNSKIEDDLKCQKEKLEKRKQNKMLQQYKRKSFVKRTQKILSACGTITVDETLNMLEQILALTEKKMFCEQKVLEEEIEQFIKRNMEDMHKNVQELKESLVNEAKSMEESGFPQVAEKLYAELDTEVEEMKSQYEESRYDGIEKIKSKHIKGLR